MRKYICKLKDYEVNKIMDRINTDNAFHELYIEKARKWIAGHYVGDIVKGKILYKQLELIVEDSEGFFEMFTVSLDSGSTVSVRGSKRNLTAENF